MRGEEGLKQRARAFEAILASLAPSGGKPEILWEAMAYSLGAPSKRVRPVLLLEAAGVFGAPAGLAEPLAVAVEMIHTYSLIHDDLPCMDDDDVRRGKPSCHVAFGYAQALLAGDALLNGAFEVILAGVPRSGDAVGPYLAAAGEIARASGAGGMVGGQSADLLAEGSPPDAAVLDFVHSKKTGALLRASLLAGAVAAGAPENDLRAFSQAGEMLGLMFQISDDLLDLTGDPALTGKKTGSDAKKDKLTYARVHGEKAARDRIRSLGEGVTACLAPYGERTVFLQDLTAFLAARTY